MRYHDYEAALTSHWLQSGIGPREAIAEFRPACGDADADDEAIQSLEAKWQGKHDALSIVFGILGDFWHRLAGFDCEDAHSPADHTNILSYLAAATSNKFAMENVTQSVELNGNLKLSFAHKGNAYALTFEDHGSWRNLPGVLAGLNSILERLDIPERFIELYAGEGPGVVVFALPNKFELAARRLGIRLELASGRER